MAWSAGFGPLLGARIFDVNGGYQIALYAYAVLFATSAVLLLWLGPFVRYLPPVNAVVDRASARVEC